MGKRIELDERCSCGGRKHAVMVPVHAFGRPAGSFDIEQRGCSSCGAMDDLGGVA
ncbi:hypothetical protein [Cellulosimicrobium funkei]|uniref:hypothetical protein n=1 Tax=Cellulosimicrobium funkei TaxID=264251 RepID=UPI003420A0A5